ncbi:LamG-like jellyroll fold domain-containing protein [Micromonospora sp. NPDC047620]|uniref:LamG-like jellyroll fold domain-containing protein n=1 Tax=Micromonospora sp. NPDC047620 TaxID=3364251 RepID=UPI0037243D7E
MAGTLAASLLTLPGSFTASTAVLTTEPATTPDAPVPASVQAARSGRRVELTDRTTPTTRIFANPNGSFTAEISHGPQRIRRDGGWVPLDTRLRARPDGAVVPVAAADLVLSGGGRAPMARLTTEGGSVELGWPTRLPRPVLDADTATYPEVLPGVDLRVTATPTGFAEMLVVKTAAAARHPALARISFGLRTRGLTVRRNAAGGVELTDRRGRPVLSSGTAWMWDSTDVGADARPGRRTRYAPMGLTVAAGRLTLTPDTALLADPRIRFPLYLDPDFTGYREHWLMVEKDLPNHGWWDHAQFQAQVGRDPRESTTDRFRSYFEMNVSAVAGKVIETAQFRPYESWAYSCTPEPVHLYQTGAITASMTWNTAPPLLVERRLDTVSAAKGGEDGASPCLEAAGHLELDATAAVTQAAAARTRTITLALASDETAGANGAKQFDPAETKLFVTYNTVPEVPELSGCVDDSMGFVPNPTPTLTAMPIDADRDVQLFGATFQWATSAGQVLGERSTELADPGTPAHVRITTPLTEGESYLWRARTVDSKTAGPWSAWCRFTIDTRPPATVPAVTSAAFPEDQRSGRQYEAGEVWLSANGDPDVVGFSYSVNGYEQPQVPAVDGQSRVRVVPTQPSDNTLVVASVDRAGQRGPERVYSFQTEPLSEAVASWQMEDYGQVAWDNTLGLHDATLTGAATFGPGRGSGGLVLDGSEQTFAATTGPVVRTDDSFTAMAWVKLADDSDWATVLSQAGERHPGFALKYSSWPRAWVFEMAAEDATTEQVAAGQASSTQLTPQVGVWTHLTGVYDHAAGQLRLYVNGRLAGIAAHRSGWNAVGRAAIGTTSWHGFHPDRWKGALDDVRLFDRTVNEAEIRDRMTPEPWGPQARWHFEETEGRTATDETGNGHILTLSGSGASWSTGRNGGGLRLDGGGGYAYTAGPVLRTDQSFSAAAWVHLDDSAEFATVLSQNGTMFSGFTLRYDPWARRWAFAMPSTDSGDGGAWPTVYSLTEPEVGVWTHLTGVYDQEAGQLRLYVNGALTGAVAHHGTWNATGQTLVGMGRNRGWPVEWFPGTIDEPVLQQGALSLGQIRELIGDNLEGSGGEWDFDLPGPSVPDQSGNKHRLTVGPEVDRDAAGHGRGKGLGFNGAGGYAATAGPVIRTTSSFTIVGWVKLDDTGGRRAVVSQQGDHSSGFSLEYSADRNRWIFAVPYDDALLPTMDRVSMAVSDGAPQRGAWTHLAGVYDAPASELRLYVNGRLSTNRGTKVTPWPARGSLQVGRAWWNGGWQASWNGVVDQLRVLDRAAVAEEIRAISGIAAPPPPGPLRLFAPYANLCLGEKSGDDSGALLLTGCAGSIPDMSVVTAGDDLYRITTDHPVYGRGCTRVADNSTQVGARIEDDYCATGAGQTRFRLIPVYGTVLRGHLLQAEHSGLCVGIAGNVATPGAPAVQLTCDPTAPGQVFELQRVPDDGVPAPGATQIRSANSGLCVGEVPADPNHLLQQSACGTASPPLRVEAAGNGRYLIKADHPVHGVGCTLVLDPSTTVGSPVADGACPADMSRAQKFRLEPVTAPLAGYRIRPLHSGHCLGIAGGSTAGGARLVQQACDPAARGQVFHFSKPGTP